MDERSRRHRFSFTLTAFLLAVTAVCLWLGWQSRIVHERRDVLQMIKARGGLVDPRSAGDGLSSWFFGALGDEPVSCIYIYPDEFSDDEIDRIRAAFPELLGLRALHQTEGGAGP
jgi:hypothetical protein